MYPGTDIYAIGTDETISFYALQSQKEEDEEPAPKAFGDVRDGLGCEYVVDLHWVGTQPYVAAGKHRYVFREINSYDSEKKSLIGYSESNLSLVPIAKGTNGPLDYDFNLDKIISLPGAHGEEIVRDLFTDITVSEFPLNLSYTQLMYASDSHHLHMRRGRPDPRLEGTGRGEHGSGRSLRANEEGQERETEGQEAW
jgi:hypothetical protein